MGNVVKSFASVIPGASQVLDLFSAGGVTDVKAPTTPEGATPNAEAESATASAATTAEKKRRQLIAQQQNLIKTTPTGAAITQNKLGGQTLTGN